ncbi:MAG: hypothetical protein BroJett011_28380 [Chloroflexota bacterium]|nr:MAG: hypothetical protein BroJett011_28380 [Chloroflexota bacterium]
MLPAHLKDNFPFKFKNVPLLIVLLVPFALLTALAVGSTGYLSFRNGQQAVNEVTTQLQREIAVQVKQELETFLETLHLLNQINANAIQDGLINPGDSAALERYFWQQLQLFENVSSIYFGNPQGGLVDAGREGAGGLLYIAATDGFAAGPFRKYAADERGNRANLLTTIPDFDARAHPWYARALASGQPAWSDIYILATGQDLALAASRPVYDTYGELLGVVSSDIFLSHLNAFLQSLTADKGGEIFIVERSGLLVAASTGDSLLTVAEKSQSSQRFLAAASNAPLIQQGAAQLAVQFGNLAAIKSRQNFTFELNGRRYLAQVIPFYREPNLDWLVVVLIPEADFMAPLHANNRNTVWLIVIVLAAVLTAGIITARWVSQPLLNLNHAAKLLAGGAWTQPLRFDHIKEINELSQSFNTMAVQLTQSLERMAAEITARRQAEEKIVASQQRFRTLIEKSMDVIVLLNATGDIIYQSPSGLRLTGYSAEERIGRSGLDLIHPDDLDHIRRLFAGLIQEPGADVSIQLRSRRKDGSWRWLEVTGANLLADPNVQAVVVNYRDITERKQVEDALRQEKDFNHTLIDSLPGIFYLFDEQSKFIRWNKNFETVSGYSSQEIARMSPLDFFREPDKSLIAERIGQVFLTGQATAEATFISKDQTPTPYFFTGTLFLLDGKPCLLGMGIDITERKRSEEENRLLLTLTKVLAEAETFDSALTLALTMVCEATEWDYGEAWLPSPAGDRLELASPYYCRVGEVESFRRISEGFVVAFGIGLPGRVWTLGSPMWVPDVTTDANFLRALSAKEAGIKSAIGIPILANNTVVAVMGFFLQGTWPEDRRMMTLVSAVAAQLGTAFQRKQAEESIRQAEAKYRALVENTPAVVYVDKADENGSCYYISPQIETLLGYPPSVYTENPTLWHKQIDPQDYQRAVRTIQETLEQGRAMAEYRLIARDGRVVWVRDSSVLIRDREGNPEFIQGFLEDITEGKQAEKLLQDLSVAVNASGDIVFMTDKEGLITSINAQFTALYGYGQEEVVGKVTPRILKSGRQSQEVYEQFWETILRGELFRGEVINKSKDGRLIFIEETVSPFLDDRGRIAGFLAIQRNITERKQLEARLLQAQKMEAIGRLAGGIAHDFNNILLPIIGYAELGLLKLPPDDDLYADLMRIRKAADRAAGLVRQILAFSRQQVLEMRVLGLNAVILDFSEMIRRLIGEDIELEIFLEPALYQVKADKGQLEQVLLNLVINARDAMPTGGKLTIETANVYLDEEYVKKYAGLQIPGYFAMLSVSDTGHGMDAATKERIFEPFFTTKEESKGTGLGLATVFGIIQQHGGSIWVYSEPDHGATFKIYLPKAENPGHNLVTAASEPAFIDGIETILVVEDEEMVRQLVCETLAAHGYSVIEAQGPSEALQLATEHKETIHLLLTDVIMPGMNGKALYHQVAAIYPSIKVLYMSGYTDNAIVHHGVLDEGVNFLQKPFTVNNLTQKVRSVLRISGHRGVKLP